MKKYAKVFIRIHDNDYPYNVQIIINGIYTGFGRFCKNWREVNEALNLYEAELIDVTFES